MILLGLAFAAGLLVAVNPSGVAIFPAFLSVCLSGDPRDQPDRSPGLVGRVLHSLKVGVAASCGFVVVYVTAGLVAAAGLNLVARIVPWAEVASGLALVGVGGWLLAGRQLGLTVPPRLYPPAGWRTQRRPRGVMAFGAAGALVSLSSTLGILLALTGQALAAEHPAAWAVDCWSSLGHTWPPTEHPRPAARRTRKSRFRRAFPLVALT